MSAQPRLLDDQTRQRGGAHLAERPAARAVRAPFGAQAERSPAAVTEIQAYPQPERAPKLRTRHGVERPCSARRTCAPDALPEFDEVYNRYFRQLCYYLQRIVRDPHSAEEVCQQTFIRVWRALPRFREYYDGSLEGWLYTIAHRCALNEIKKRREELPLDPAKLQVSEPFDMRAITKHWIDNEDIERRFTQLPLVQQQVLTLRYLFDMSCAEAAETLGRTTTCVTSIEHRARRTLSQSAAPALGRTTPRAHAA